MARRIPADIPDPAAADARSVLNSIRTNLYQLFGVTGSILGRAMTVQDMMDIGLASVKDGKIYSLVASSQASASSAASNEPAYSTARIVVDFMSGAAVGSYTFGVPLPVGSQVIQAQAHVSNAFTGTAGATLSLGIETDSATGLLGPTALASLGANANFLLTPNLLNTGTWTTTTTAERRLVANIGAAPMTAGRIVVHLQYLVHR
jgi:hypothetical protein